MRCYYALLLCVVIMLCCYALFIYLLLLKRQTSNGLQDKMSSIFTAEFQGKLVLLWLRFVLLTSLREFVTFGCV